MKKQQRFRESCQNTVKVLKALRLVVREIQPTVRDVTRILLLLTTLYGLYAQHSSNLAGAVSENNTISRVAKR